MLQFSTLNALIKVYFFALEFNDIYHRVQNQNLKYEVFEHFVWIITEF